MKFLKKIGGLFLLILITGLIIFLIKCLVDKTKESILIENKIQITPTPNETLDLVIKVIDGDTVIVKLGDKEESVRLIGIDAPEKDMCFSNEAKEKLRELVENKKVKLEADGSQNDRDKYDRLLRYIYLDDGTLVNEKMVKDGFAKEYTYKINYKFQREFRDDEKMAKENKLGLWSFCK